MRSPSPSKTTPKHRGRSPRPRAKVAALDQPAVDERLVMPETRFEIVDGKVEYVAPADEPHGNRHSKVAAVLDAHVAPAFDTAIDMLTRTSVKGDMAPDVSVYPRERDPETGGRKLEVLAFEVVSTERLAHAAKKASALVERGVRRVFAIDVARKRVLAWSRATDAWEMLDPEGVIEDDSLALPVPIRALVDSVFADTAIATALLSRGNSVLVGALAAADAHGEARGEARGEVRGVAAGKVDAIFAILSARGIAVGDADAARIRAMTDGSTLDRWIAKGAVCGSLSELFTP